MTSVVGKRAKVGDALAQSRTALKSENSEAEFMQWNIFFPKEF